MSESKNQRFRRLAASRGNRLIREISLLGNLANKKNYSYTEEEVERLFVPIEKELSEIKKLFRAQSESEGKVSFHED
ncbi:hypothetical protein [Marinobacter sp. BGYM27]|uniref:hypothetical protein n=1 Tax=Marinobacter sp. BGYM27 TaxID=2975597 RepID=UPI0021A5670C|nr:hypothetical protein [Marinobacter sp. BGYM27]MDG5499172.1 hypothetical protein [Marinobacter sp. BGYM27]